MCKGRGDPESCRRLSPPAAVGRVSCELCDSEASLYCQADDAFLCRKCDGWVHGANFLAQRHIRCLLCGVCRSLTQRYLIGTSVQVVLPTIVSSPERSSSCNSRVEGSHENSNKTLSTTLKKPFLFL
ncbi:PREDICTED: B-box domain protein 30-like [Ipomoea nil]|uniref:B-box domain protein 30-like n=1 Tax=Ipomoea nil TaxID=35883 RepID=UPI000900E95E|nr:PREDICTED: B-box domain protein 30-like [Ipomoea nil]